MAKKTIAQKEPVKLREKKLSNGNISLYLDIYRNGKRHKEYLKLYLTQVSDLAFRQFVHMPVVLPASCCFR